MPKNERNFRHLLFKPSIILQCSFIVYVGSSFDAQHKIYSYKIERAREFTVRNN